MQYFQIYFNVILFNFDYGVYNQVYSFGTARATLTLNRQLFGEEKENVKPSQLIRIPKTMK